MTWNRAGRAVRRCPWEPRVGCRGALHAEGGSVMSEKTNSERCGQWTHKDQPVGCPCGMVCKFPPESVLWCAHSFRMRQHAALSGPCPHPRVGRDDEAAGLTGLRRRAVSQVSQCPQPSLAPEATSGPQDPSHDPRPAPHPAW